MRKSSKTSGFGTTARISHDSSAYYQSKLYSGTSAGELTSLNSDNPFPSQYENMILHKSAESMQEIPDCSVHLMVTSPPYNAAKEYDKDLSLVDYLQLLKNVFSETYRI